MTSMRPTSSTGVVAGRSGACDEVQIVQSAFRAAYERLVFTALDTPTASTVVGTLESIISCPIALTDDAGSVLDPSPSYDRGPRLAPPPEPARQGPVVIDGSLVASSIVAPNRYHLWALDHADIDLATSMLVTIGLELAVLLKRFVLSGISSQWRDSSHLANRMIRGDGDERLREHATRLAHDLDRVHHVVVIVPASWAPTPRFAVMIGPRVHRFGLISVRDDHLAMVVGGDDALEELLSVLDSIGDAGSFRVGVGSSRPTGLDLSTSYEEALLATRLDPARPASRIVRYVDTSPVAVLAHNATPESIDRLVQVRLGALLDYDREHRSDLVPTLREWLDATDSLDAVAQRLHIHRSTLVYRIRRIKELLGDDLSDGSTRFDVSLALRLLAESSNAGESVRA